MNLTRLHHLSGWIRTVLLTILAAALASAAFAQDRDSSSSDFALVYERNIFNPNRSPAPPPSLPQAPRETPPPQERLELVGSMVFGQQAVAFFDGSASEARGAFSQGQEILDLVVKQVDTEKVILEGQETEMELRVGMAIVRTGDEPWQEGGTASLRSAPATAPSAESPSSTESIQSGGGSPSDLLQRLRERRQRELER